MVCMLWTCNRGHVKSYTHTQTNLVEQIHKSQTYQRQSLSIKLNSNLETEIGVPNIEMNIFNNSKVQLIRPIENKTGPLIRPTIVCPQTANFDVLCLSYS